MNSLIQLKKATPLLLIALVLACFALSPAVQAVSPPPAGGYPNNNTAGGDQALFSNTTGADNTVTGFQALFKNTAGGSNTANGAFALFSNTTGVGNTATGDLALFRNTTGTNNTATGFQALLSNTTGLANTANGAFALTMNTTGFQNTATGLQALVSNTTGADNTANGFQALLSNTTGGNNTANGDQALFLNTTGFNNTATGFQALLGNTTGSGNVAVGFLAGNNQTSGSDNIYIGAGMQGVAGESNACYIASIFGQTSANGVPVLINQSNKLGTATSSARFKRDIHDMDKASEALFALRPVAFRYKEEIDPAGISQLGLVAEEVEKVNSDLVVRDKDGNPYSVRYDQVNAMLLNEFLKEHRKVELQDRRAHEQQKEIDALKAELREQEALIQKVSAQFEVSKSAPQTVVNNQ